MKEEYDLSTMKARKNPYAAKLKNPVTLHLNDEVINYFKAMADESGVSYQSLINVFTRLCYSTAKNGYFLGKK
jgi:uncharacterized protein (DUF4415 family)